MGRVCDVTQKSHDQNLDLARRIGVIEEQVFREGNFGVVYMLIQHGNGNMPFVKTPNSADRLEASKISKEPEIREL